MSERSAITYRVDGGRRPSPAHERLVVEADGTFTMWRSLATLTTPASPGGRFGGRLTDGVAGRLRDAAAAATAAGDLDAGATPDGAVQQVSLDGATGRAGMHAEVGGPWGDLLGGLQEQLSALAGQPVAAVAVSVEADASAARLRLLGSEPLRLDLGNADVRVVLWHQGTKTGDWRSAPLGAGTVEAESGWSYELPFDHGLERRGEDHLDVYVSLQAADGDRIVPVLLFQRLE
jgi:hypothetical protein